MIWKQMALIAIGKVSRNNCFETVFRLCKRKKKLTQAKHKGIKRQMLILGEFSSR